MKYLHFFILLSFVIMFNCDGRERSYKKNSEVLSENRLLQSFSEKIESTPKQYTEIVNDTILSNYFRIKLKYYSLLDNVVIEKHGLKNEVNYTHYYSNFEANLNIQYPDNTEFGFVLNKELFQNEENISFWNKAIMQYPWIDYEASTNSSICLNVSFCKIESVECLDYRITFTKEGSYSVEEINLLKTNI